MEDITISNAQKRTLAGAAFSGFIGSIAGAFYSYRGRGSLYPYIVGTAVNWALGGLFIFGGREMLIQQRGHDDSLNTLAVTFAFGLLRSGMVGNPLKRSVIHGMLLGVAGTAVHFGVYGMDFWRHYYALRRAYPQYFEYQSEMSTLNWSEWIASSPYLPIVFARKGESKEQAWSRKRGEQQLDAEIYDLERELHRRMKERGRTFDMRFAPSI